MLQEDLRMLREKVKRRQAVIERQEEDINSRDQALKEADLQAKQAGQKTGLLRESMCACQVCPRTGTCNFRQCYHKQ